MNRKVNSKALMSTLIAIFAVLVLSTVFSFIFVGCSDDLPEGNPSQGTDNDGLDGDNECQQSNNGDEQDNAAKQSAKDAYNRYVNEQSADGKAVDYMIYESNGRFVALYKGETVGVFAGKEEAMKSMLDDPATAEDESERYKFSISKIENLFEVYLNEKVVDLVIFMGQSNMSGRGVASQAPTVPSGYGYEFRAFSDPTKLYPVSEPFGVTENNPKGVTENTPKTGSMVSALMNAYYADRGVPIVGVSCSRGGTNIAYWAPNGAALNDAVSRHNTAKKWLEDNGYTIANDFMVWCQGEADRNRPTDYYTESLDAIIDEMISEAGIDFCAVVRIGNMLNYPGECDKLIKAQTAYCKSSEKAILASAKAAGFGADKMKADGTHYTQTGYNLIGTDSGHNIAYYVINGKEATMYDPKLKLTYPTDDIPEDPVEETPSVNYAESVEFTFDNSTENGIDLSSIGTVNNGVLSVTTDSNNENGIKMNEAIRITVSEGFTFEFVVDYSSPGSQYPGILLSEGSTSGGFIFLNSSQIRLRDKNKTDFDGAVSSAIGPTHFAIVYDVESNTISVYQNYQKISVTNADKILSFGSITLTHLCGGYNSTYKFRGDLHYMKYVNKALEVDEFHREPITEESGEKKLEFLFNDEWENGINIGSLGTVADGELTMTRDSSLPDLMLKDPIVISENESFTIELVSTFSPDSKGCILLSEGRSMGYFYFNNQSLRLRNSAKIAIDGYFENQPISEMNHFAVVYNAETKELKMYLNYIEIYSDTDKLGEIGTLNLKYFLSGYDSQFEYTGTISYFKYENQALTVDDFHKEA